MNIKFNDLDTMLEENDAQDIIAEFSKQLNEVNRKKQEEKRKRAKITDARYAAIKALKYYFTTLDYIDTEDAVLLEKELTDVFQNLEKYISLQMKCEKTLLNHNEISNANLPFNLTHDGTREANSIGKTKKMNYDTILKNFVANLD